MKQVPARIRRAAEIMLGELESNRLTVHKVPSRRRDGAGRPTGLVRVVEQDNPAWYQEFCEGYDSVRSDAWKWRKHKTSIKREHTAKGLRYLAAGSMGPLQNHLDRDPPYTVRLLPVVEKWIEDERERRKAERAEKQACRAEILTGVPF